jgi:hypothetical protein
VELRSYGSSMNQLGVKFRLAYLLQTFLTLLTLLTLKEILVTMSLLGKEIITGQQSDLYNSPYQVMKADEAQAELTLQ